MKNNSNNNSVNLKTYRASYIVTGGFFVILFAACLIIFSVVAFNAGREYEITIATAGTISIIMSAAAIAAVLICAALTAVRCAKAGRIKNPAGFTPPRDMFYYLKRMGFIALIIILMNTGASLVGMFINSILAGIFLRIDNAFLSGFLMKLPLFILYTAFIYKMLVRFGFMDSERKIFNPNLKTMAFILAFMIMLPGAVYDNYFYAPESVLESSGMVILNVQTVLSPNESVYIHEMEGFVVNKDFNSVSVVLIAVTVFATFLIQVALFRFAYNRGKKIFIKQHIREVGEYEMDENI